jgi:hypothetical protein
VDSLTADVVEIARWSGHEWGTQTLMLDAGPSHAGQEFVFFGTMSGTEPGFTESGLTIPINPDAYTDILTRQPQLSPITPLHGFLDATGRATATFELVRRWRSETIVGETFHHAFVLHDGLGQVVFVSNAVPVTILP